MASEAETKSTESTIKAVKARMIYDSRGNPTVSMCGPRI